MLLKCINVAKIKRYNISIYYSSWINATIRGGSTVAAVDLAFVKILRKPCGTIFDVLLINVDISCSEPTLLCSFPLSVHSYSFTVEWYCLIIFTLVSTSTVYQPGDHQPCISLLFGFYWRWLLARNKLCRIHTPRLCMWWHSRSTIYIVFTRSKYCMDHHESNYWL